MPGARLSYAGILGFDYYTHEALQDEALKELLSSPLMLHVAALAYKGRPAADLIEPGSVRERRQRLWQAYVDRMFELRPLPDRYGYTREQAIDWLAKLSRILQDQDQTQFRPDSLTRAGFPISLVLFETVYGHRRRPSPRHCEAFLNAMTKRLLLRRDGQNYYFIHRLLRDHFAEDNSESMGTDALLGDGWRTSSRNSLPPDIEAILRDIERPPSQDTLPPPGDP